MNIIITGGCGFVGSALCLFLKKNLKNCKILSIDNLSKNYSKFNQAILNKNKIKNKKIDLGNSNSFNKINFKADYIIDCSAEPAVEISKKKTVKVIESNFLSTVNILQKVKKDNSKLIFISSSRVYPITESYKKFKRYKKLGKHLPYKEESNFNDTKTIYGFTKYCSEHLIKEYNYSENTKFIINRCGLISGPGQYGKVEQGLVALWMWRHINKMKVTYLGHGGNGNQVRDVLFIKDLCKLILIQIKQFKKFENEIFCIGGGTKNAINLKNLTKLCQNITKNKIKIMKNLNTSIYDIPYYVTSINKINKISNWKPRINLSQGLLEIYNWMILNKKKIKKFF